MPVSGYRPYGARRAQTYEAQRQTQPEWLRETAIIAAAVAMMRRGDRVLDVPVGTGRFLSLYADHGLTVTGIDLSPDMLTEARRKQTGATLLQGNVLTDHLVKAVRGFVDYTVCLRLLNWLTPLEAERVVCQLLQVTRHAVWVGLWSAERAGLKAKSAETHSEADVSRWIAEGGWQVVTQHVIVAGTERTSAIWELRRK